MKITSKEPKESITIKLTQAEASAFLAAVQHLWIAPIDEMRRELLRLGIVAQR